MKELNGKTGHQSTPHRQLWIKWKKLGFEVEYIHAGKTSVEQHWEMHLNRKEKALVSGV